MTLVLLFKGSNCLILDIINFVPHHPQESTSPWQLSQRPTIPMTGLLVSSNPQPRTIFKEDTWNSVASPLEKYQRTFAMSSVWTRENRFCCKVYLSRTWGHDSQQRSGGPKLVCMYHLEYKNNRNIYEVGNHLRRYANEDFIFMWIFASIKKEILHHVHLSEMKWLAFKICFVFLFIHVCQSNIFVNIQTKEIKTDLGIVFFFLLLKKSKLHVHFQSNFSHHFNLIIL